MVTASLTSSSDQQAAEQQEGAEHTSAAAAGAAAAGAAPAASDPPPTAPIKQTMANLDALLGIEPEVEPAVLAVQQQQQAAGKAAEGPRISISPDVLRALAEAEAARAEKMGSSTSNKELQSRVADSIERIVEQAKRLSEAEAQNGGGGQAGADPSLGDKAVQQELSNLYSLMAGTARGVNPDDVKRMKAEVFGPSTFWVTETRALAVQSLDLGVVVRGNLRGPLDVVYADVCRRMEQLFGDKYVVRLVEDLEATLDESEASSSGSQLQPRVQFEVLPAAAALPAPVTGWQRGVAALLLVLTAGSALQFGLAANLGLLPKETLAWLANPANVNAAGDALPPGLDLFDPLPFLSSAANVFLATMLPQLLHEVAHAVVASTRDIKVGPSFLIPNSQLGTFGSVTQFKSLVRNRTDLFDFAAAGLGAGGAASLLLFLVGLAASHGGTAADPGLIPVPAQLFQGSFLLGSLAQLGLGSDALSGSSQVFVSPLLIGGWCGLVTTALNCLPVGNLDGGRMMLSAFGRSSLSLSSLLTYVGLGLGLLGSSLSLPFGLYVLICQRSAEQSLQNEVSGVTERRRAIAAGLIVFAVLTLAPMLGVGPDLDLGGGMGGGDSLPSNFI